MRFSARLGAALSAVGILAAGSTVFATSAQADVLVPAVDEYSPQSSSTSGGQVMTIYGQDLYGLEKVTFGDTEAAILYAETDPDYGSFIAVEIPAHKVGVVPVVAWIDPSSAEIPTETVTETATVTSTVTSIVSTSSSETTTVESSADETTGDTVLSTTELSTSSSQQSLSRVAAEGLDPAVVAALEPVEVGDFEYLAPWTQGLKPDSGPVYGGTNVVIDGPFIEDAVFSLCSSFGQTRVQQLAADSTTRNVGPAAVEFAEVPMDVFFDDVPATNARIVVDENFELTIKATSPEHKAGVVDVTVVFYDAACSDSDPRSAVSPAALPPISETDIALTRSDAFTYIAAPAASDTVTQVVTVTAAPTSNETTAVETTAPTTSTEPAVATSTAVVAPTSAATSTGPVLSATGVNSSTVPMVLAGLALLGAGAVFLAASRRTVRRQH